MLSLILHHILFVLNEREEISRRLLLDFCRILMHREFGSFIARGWCCRLMDTRVVGAIFGLNSACSAQ